MVELYGIELYLNKAIQLYSDHFNPHKNNMLIFLNNFTALQFDFKILEVKNHLYYKIPFSQVIQSYNIIIIQNLY